MKLVIVDYGMGNITSIISALNYIGEDDIVVSNDFRVLNDADKLLFHVKHNWFYRSGNEIADTSITYSNKNFFIKKIRIEK